MDSIVVTDVSSASCAAVKPAAVASHVVCTSRAVHHLQDNATALITASRKGRTEVVTMLIENGANVDRQDKDGWTSLMWAAFRGHSEIVATLLAANADPNVKRKGDGMTALMRASSLGHLRVVAMLVDQGADLNLQNRVSRPLHAHANLYPLCAACLSNASDHLRLKPPPLVHPPSHPLAGETHSLGLGSQVGKSARK